MTSEDTVNMQGLSSPKGTRWRFNVFKAFFKEKIGLRDGPKLENVSSSSVKRCSSKVLVMGSAGVGKSAIIRSICGVPYESNYNPTVLDILEKQVLLENADIRLEFIDLSGYYPFPAMKKVYIEQADQFVLVYAKHDEESFREIHRLKQEICRIKGKHSTELSILVVRNKVDKIPSRKAWRDDRTQSVLSWCYSAVDASALSGYNINQVLEHILVECKNRYMAPELKTNMVSGRYVYSGMKRSASFNNRKRLSRLMSNRGSIKS